MPGFIDIAATVNGVAATRAVGTTGANVISILEGIHENGDSSTQDVQTDGSGWLSPSTHRVACIGGTTNGIDHFPVDFVSSSARDASAYPATLSLDDMLFLYWLVKTWRVHGTLTKHTGAGDVSFSFDFNTSMGDDDSGSNPVVNESDLVVPRNLFESNNPGSEEEGLVSVNLLGSATVLDVGSGTPYKPFIVFTSYDGGDIGQFMQTEKTGTYVNAIPAIDASIEIPAGNEMPLIFYTGAIAPGVSFDGTFKMVPTEWWPYATRAAAAVYDTSDGSTLNPPLS